MTSIGMGASYHTSPPGKVTLKLDGYCPVLDEGTARNYFTLHPESPIVKAYPSNPSPPENKESSSPSSADDIPDSDESHSKERPTIPDKPLFEVPAPPKPHPKPRSRHNAKAQLINSRDEEDGDEADTEETTTIRDLKKRKHCH